MDDSREIRARLRAWLLVAILSGALASPAGAILHVDLGDPESHEWTATYRFVDSDPGKSSMDVLPYEAEIEVVEVSPEKAGPPLRWEMINAGEEGKQKVRVLYPEPIPPGGRFGFRLVAKMKDANAYFEDSAKLNFLYRTGHEIYVTLPRGYYPFYTDEPMELKLEAERVVVSSKGGKERPIVLFAYRCVDGKRVAPTPPPANAQTPPPARPLPSPAPSQAPPESASDAPPDTIE
jgi:hypothetical protein